jgi:hypothetical protein
MQIVVVSRLALVLAVLDRALSTDGDLAAGFLLHGLLCHATWPNDKPNEVVIGVALQRDVKLLLTLDWQRLIVGRGLCTY